MAVRWAVQNGNWSNPSTWNDNTLPGNGDDVYANGKVVTVDIDLVGQYRPASLWSRANSSYGIAAGGRFNVSSSRQIGESGYPISVYGPDVNSAWYGCLNVSVKDVTIYANVYGGTLGYCFGVHCAHPSGTVVINGNVSGGSYSNAYGAYNASVGTIIINDSVRPVSTTNSTSVFNNSTGIVVINADVYGGRNASSVYANNGLIVINGDLRWDESLSNAAAVVSTSVGKIILNGSVHNLYGTTGIYGWILLTGRILYRNGASHFTAYAEDDGNGVATGNPVIHYGTALHSGSMPGEQDVRYGVTYGPGNVYTGTCYVPSPESVLYGVPVDDTVGTAAVDRESIRAAVWDLENIEEGITAAQAMSLILAALAGVLSGAGTDTVTIKAAGNSDISRIIALVDENGNRLSIQLNPPA
jgi:hypothetical protein